MCLPPQAGAAPENLAFVYSEAFWLLIQHMKESPFACPADRVDAASGTRHHPL